jgi:hypothetical protein
MATIILFIFIPFLLSALARKMGASYVLAGGIPPFIFFCFALFGYEFDIGSHISLSIWIVAVPVLIVVAGISFLTALLVKRGK